MVEASKRMVKAKVATHTMAAIMPLLEAATTAVENAQASAKNFPEILPTAP